MMRLIRNRINIRQVCAFSVAASLLASPSIAADEAADGADNEIIVTGTKEGYRTVETTSGTKTNTPILDVPQSISVVTSEQIRDQNIRSMGDIVRLIPGVSAGQGEGHRDQITLRGNNSTADFFVDGLRDDVQYFRSFYNVDRVEAHKGPNAMIFGRGGGGGIINRITKGPQTDKQLVFASAAIDSFGGWTLAADLNQPVGNGAARLNAFYETLENHRASYGGHHLGVNPVVGANLGNWKVQLGYEYLKDDRVIDRGIPSDAGRPLNGFYKTFFGVAGINQAKFEGHVVSFRSVGHLSPQLDLSTQALYGDYDKVYTNAFAATAVNRNTPSPTLGIEAYRDPTKRKNFIGQANLQWTGKIGPTKHVILFGGEFTNQDTQNERINGFFNSTVLSAANRRAIVPLANPISVPQIFFVPGASGNSNRSVASGLSQRSVYVQDQIKFGDQLEFIGGVRYDRFDLAITNRFTNVVVKRIDNLWSPRAGLVFKPVPEASLYLSYSRSYLPQAGDQFLTFDVTNAALEPEEFENFEVGAKWNIRPDLTATMALYQLDRTNTRAAGATPGTVALTGKQRSKGVEVGLTGKILPVWQIAFGYAYSDAKITATTAAAPVGTTLAQTPEHQISLWNRLQVSKKLGLGLGVYHQSRSFATISNAVTLPAYTRIDAAVFYRVTDKIEAQLNFENLADARYFPTAHNDNNLTPGAPFNVRFSVNAKF